jgi:hypothetical protein
MPRFFFHLRNAHKSLQDCEGMAFTDADAARAQALATLRDFVQPSTGRVHPEWQSWLMQIADERGRCVFSIPFADAAEVTARDQPPERGARQERRVVYLDVERARREFSSVENEVRRRIHHMAALVDRARDEARSLNEMLRVTTEVRRRSQELLARSRSQSLAADWCRPDAGGVTATK